MYIKGVTQISRLIYRQEYREADRQTDRQEEEGKRKRGGRGGVKASRTEVKEIQRDRLEVTR